MKILFIDHPEADYQAAILYIGLRRELGDDNVVDWPYKPSYHGIVDDTYTPPGSEQGFTPPFPWMIASSGRRWSDEEVKSRVREFDVVVLASPRTCNRMKLAELIGSVGREAIKRLVLLDGEDYDHIRWDYVAQFAPSVYLKREALSESLRGEHHPAEKAAVKDRVRVVPFQLASVVRVLPELPKTYDVVFLGGGNYPGGRDQLVKILQSRLGSHYTEHFQHTDPNYINQQHRSLRSDEIARHSNYMSYDRYLETLSRARIAIAPRAWSWSALRRWETLSCPGTLLLRDHTPLIEPMPFIDGETCAYFDSIESAPDVALSYLEDEPRRAAVAAAGNKHLRAHHTAQARAKQLIEEAFA